MPTPAELRVRREALAAQRSSGVARVSSPADVGGGYEAFQYRTLLAVSASLGLPYHLVTGDVRQANYSSLRAQLVEFRRRVQQLQHGPRCSPAGSRKCNVILVRTGMRVAAHYVILGSTDRHKLDPEWRKLRWSG